MANPYGTLGALDLLTNNFQSVYQIGEELAYQSIAAALEAHNRILGEQVADFCEVGTDVLRVYGTAQTMGMDEIDEYGTPDAQKIAPGVLCGFPLRRFGGSLQWTLNYFRRATGDEIAGQVNGLMDADAQQVIRQIKRAIYLPSNYTFRDRLTKPSAQIDIPVKALVNNDGAALPSGPNGEIFSTSHTHYNGVASGGTFAEADMQALINTVIEHYAKGQAVVVINQAQESAVRAMTDFQRYYDSSVNVGQNITYGKGVLDTIQIYNRAIGTIFGAEVWVKPWAIANYAFCYLRQAPKTLFWRNPDYMKGMAPNALSLEFEDEEHPLRAKTYAREFGVSVWNRTNGAVLDIAHTTSYTAPTI